MKKLLLSVFTAITVCSVTACGGGVKRPKPKKIR